MTGLVKIIAVILFIAFLPKLIVLAGIYVVAIYGIAAGYYLLKSFFGYGEGGNNHNSSSERDGWSGTGNPHV